eukprot:1855405-Pleurochrysis_carterae.AAC.1
MYCICTAFHALESWALRLPGCAKGSIYTLPLSSDALAFVTHFFTLTTVFSDVSFLLAGGGASLLLLCGVCGWWFGLGSTPAFVVFW